MEEKRKSHEAVGHTREDRNLVRHCLHTRIEYLHTRVCTALIRVGFEVWIGEAVEIQKQRARKERTDRHDAQRLLRFQRQLGHGGYSRNEIRCDSPAWVRPPENVFTNGSGEDKVRGAPGKMYSAELFRRVPFSGRSSKQVIVMT